jgi:hypothetical protein
MCTQKTTFADLINRYGIAAMLLHVLHTFVLASSSCTCEEDLSEVPYFVLPVHLRRFVWICPVLWFRDHSEIELKSLRFRCIFPRRSITSNLGRYKAIYSLLTTKLSLFLNLLS